MNEEFLSRLSKTKESQIPCVIVTLVSVRGSAPQEIGARMIVSSKGLVFGTVGGGKVEVKAIDVAKLLLESDNTHDFGEWNLQTDVGMTCGGVVGFFFEKIIPQSNWKIAVFGAGHVAQDLVRLLVKLDCEITCIDPRSEWLDKLPEHHKLKKIQTDDMKSVLINLPANTFITSVTMGHAYDLPILKVALTEFNFPYVGAIGSEAKARVLKADLKNAGLNESIISKLQCPIGEPFGNNSPVEIAFSIVAQLIKARDQFSSK